MRGSVASLAAVVLAAALGVLAVAGPSAGGAEPSAGAAAKARGRVVFTARFDSSAGPYAKGSIPFVAVRNPETNGAWWRSGVLIRRHEDPTPARTLPPGRVLATVRRVVRTRRPPPGPLQPILLDQDRQSGRSESITAKAVFKGGASCRLQLDSDWPPRP